MVLEGNEMEGKIGDVGSYLVDVNDKGEIIFSAVIQKDFGYAKVSSVNSVSANIIHLAEQVAKKTSATWDDVAVETIKKILGIV